MAIQDSVAAAIETAIAQLKPAAEWRKSYQAFQDEVIADAIKLNPSRAAEAMYSGTLPMHMLSVDLKTKHMSRFRELTGLDSILESLGGIDAGGDIPSTIQEVMKAHARGASNILSNIGAIRGIGEDSPFGSLPIIYQKGDHPVKAILAGLFLNMDKRVRSVRSGLGTDALDAANVSHHFGPGITSLPRLDKLDMSTSIVPGSKTMIFDIETAGLTRNQIREVSYQYGTMGKEMQTETLLSRPRLFARGTVGDPKVGSLSLEEFANGMYGGKLLDAPTRMVGDDFAERMIPFLNKVIESDTIVGHNILKFDIPQIFQQLASSGKYGRDPTFRALVDQAHTAAKAKAVDTYVMAQNATNLTGISIAKELKGVKKFTPHSISNLLLETNLLELEPGLKANIMGGGLHVAEHDAAVTLAIAKHMGNLTPQPLTDPALRKAIFEASAITPITDITNISEPVRQHLENIGRSNISINPIEHQALQTRNLNLGLPTDIGTIVSPDNLLFDNNILQRNIYEGFSTTRDPSQIFMQARRISADEFSGIQKQLAARNMPFAGLSQEERMFGTALGQLTSQVGFSGTELGSRISNIATDLMNARFEEFGAGSSAFEYTTKYTGRVSLPAGLLESAGLLNIDDPALLTLSEVSPTIAAPEARVNLIYGLKDETRGTLIEHIKGLAGKSDNEVLTALGYDLDSFISMGGSEDELTAALDKFKKAVADTTDEGLLALLKGSDLTGIAVGQLQPKEAESVIRLMKQFNITDILRDDKNLQIAMAYGGRERGAINTFGAILTRHLGETELGSIGKQVTRSLATRAGYRNLARDSAKFAIADSSAKMASGVGINPALKAGYDIWQVARKHLGVGLLGIAALGVGGIGHKRHKQNDFYGQAMDQMPYENGGMRSNYGVAQLLQAKIDSGIDKSYQRYDPLSTAFVTSDLDAGKINHTSMAFDKNNTLYGGVL